MFKAKLLIISPTYNDSQYISRTIESVLKQTIRPDTWIIVDDGSSDDTVNIVESYITSYPWIKLHKKERGNLAFGKHVYDAFRIAQSYTDFSHFSYIMKLDTDLDIDSCRYIEDQINLFNKDKRMGITSGLTYYVNNNRKHLTVRKDTWRTTGALKLYRRECFFDIGGITPVYGWDGLDEYKAMFYGWKTSTVSDLHVNHLGKRRALSRDSVAYTYELKGQSLYLRGYPFWFVILKSLMYVPVGILHSRSLLVAYIHACINNIPKLVTKEEEAFIKRFNFHRALWRIFGYKTVFFRSFL